MRSASGRLLLDANHVGTAWRCHARYALTARHCLPETLPTQVALHFPGRAPVPARPLREARSVDAVLLELTDDAGDVPVLELAQPPPEDAPDVSWKARAYPEVNDGQETILAGVVRGYVDTRFGRAMQLGVDDITNRILSRDRSQMSLASGAAVTHNGAAVGLLRSGLTDTQIAHATPMDVVVRAFDEIRTPLGYPLAPEATAWLDCDRKKQWRETVGAIADRGTRIVAFGGGLDEAHALFLRRVEVWLARERRGVWRVVPGTPDWTRKDLLAGLSQAFGGAPDSDESRLASRLRGASGERAVVAHPVLRLSEREDVDLAISYYQTVAGMLPQQPPGFVFLQPLEWTGWFAKRHASRFVKELARLGPEVVSPPDLAPITEDDLTEVKASPDAIARWKRTRTSIAAFRALRGDEE